MLVTRNLLKDQVIADSGTFVFDIKDKANLHALLVEVTATNGATAGLALPNMVTAIRVIKNGAEDVIVGSGNSLRQVAHDVGCPFTSDVYNLGAGIVQTIGVPIMFGQELVDPNYYIQTANLDSLQFRMDYAMTVAATGIATGTTKLSLIAIYEYDSPLGQYKGYMRTRTVYSFTSAASGDITVPIPVGQTLASVHICDNTYADDCAAVFTNVQYRANQGDRVFYNDSGVRLRRILQLLSPTRVWALAGTYAQYEVSCISFNHNPYDMDQGFIPANTYKYLELILTQGTASKPIIIAVRDVLT